MQYIGDEIKVSYNGRATKFRDMGVIEVVNPEGVPYLLLATGGIVPDNWTERRIRITVELLP